MFQEPPAPEQDPFVAIVRRDGAMIFLKGSGDPLPNPKRYSSARWDAYLNVLDPGRILDSYDLTRFNGCTLGEANGNGRE